MSNLHVELISMSITDFSAIVRYRPLFGRSHEPDVLSTQLPIRCQHYLVCLVLHKCTLLISGSRWVWTEAKPCCLFVMFFAFVVFLLLFFFCSDVFLIIPWLCRSHEWRKKGLESQSSTGRVAPVPTLRFKASPSHSLQPRSLRL